MAKKETPKDETSKEETPKEPIKGVSQELYDTARNIIISGFKNKASADVIKTTLIKEGGVPFNRLPKLYSVITQAEGLVVNIQDLKASIKDVVVKVPWTFKETYEAILEVVGHIVESVKDADKSRCISVIKTHFKENEKEFPRRPATTRGRMGGINKTLINVFAENKEASEKDIREALKGVVKTDKNAADYAKQYHKLLYAVANGLTANKALTAFASKTE